MCGICGIISREKVDKIDLRIQYMLNAISHRGPNAEGKVIINEKIAMGHRRLSIIDIDIRSNQPMKSEAGNIISYNGEVYNYMDIRTEIDYNFTTKSDTEVVLSAIETKGINWFLEKSNGMFAFSYYDVKHENIYLARDRMGIKPLFYYYDGEKIIYASEIKAILQSGLVDAILNESAIDEYLANRYVRSPYTFFENIFQLRPGHYLQIDDEGNIKEIEYWRLPSEFNVDSIYNEEEILNEFEEQVKQAVFRRMISDVTVGTYLSGGVDSSLITAIASQNHKKGLHTYTIGFDELNEFDYARVVSEKYETIHHEILMNMDEYFDMMDEVIGYKDAPLGVPNEVPLAVMSKELKKNITVVLSGEGADELMGGYGRIYRSPFDYTNLGINNKKTYYDYFIELYEYVPRNIRDEYLNLNTSLRDKFDEKLRKEFLQRTNEENVFRFFHEYHVKGLLERVDRTTMLAGVEARVPFLDHTLIEYVYKNIPYTLKLKWNEQLLHGQLIKSDASCYSEVMDTPKYLLRKVALNYLPDEVVTRKKIGFPVPLNSWINTLEKDAKKLLEDAYWIKQEKLDDLLKCCKHQQRFGQIIWMLINVEMFRKKYFLRNWRY